jgi:hypothetical protein
VARQDLPQQCKKVDRFFTISFSHVATVLQTILSAFCTRMQFLDLNTLQLQNVWHHTHSTRMWPLVLYQRPHCQFTAISSCCTLCVEAWICLQILSIYLYTYSKGQSRGEDLGTRLTLNWHLTKTVSIQKWDQLSQMGPNVIDCIGKN